jgi:hypothetical protein
MDEIMDGIYYYLNADFSLNRNLKKMNLTTKNLTTKNNNNNYKNKQNSAE